MESAHECFFFSYTSCNCTGILGAGKLYVLLRSCKIEVVSFPCISHESVKTQISNLLESRFSESAELGLKRKASLSKVTLKRKTTKIFVSRLLELSLQKHWCKCLYI